MPLYIFICVKFQFKGLTDRASIMSRNLISVFAPRYHEWSCGIMEQFVSKQSVLREYFAVEKQITSKS